MIRNAIYACAMVGLLAATGVAMAAPGLSVDAGGNVTINGKLTVNGEVATTKRVIINKKITTTPSLTVDSVGNVTIEGNLIVKGSTTTDDLTSNGRIQADGDIDITSQSGYFRKNWSGTYYRLDYCGPIRRWKACWYNPSSFLGTASGRAEPIDAASQLLMGIDGVYYSEEGAAERPSARTFGLIPGTIEDKWPSIVSEDPAGNRQVDYEQVVAVLVEALKDQQKSLESLTRDVEVLRAKVETLGALTP